MDSQVMADVVQSPAVAILCDLERDGFRVQLGANDCVVITPGSRLTSARMAEITRYKGALRTLLRCCDDGVQARREAFRRAIDAAKPGTLTALLFRADVPHTRGRCFSCADDLVDLGFGRCWRCSLGFRLACRLPIPVDLAGAMDTVRASA